MTNLFLNYSLILIKKPPHTNKGEKNSKTLLFITNSPNLTNECEPNQATECEPNLTNEYEPNQATECEVKKPGDGIVHGLLRILTVCIPSAAITGARLFYPDLSISIEMSLFE